MIAKSPDAKRAGLFRCVKTYGREAQLAFKLNLTVRSMAFTNIAVVVYIRAIALWCGRKARMVEGRATRTVIDLPQHSYTQRLLQTVPRL